MLHFLTAAGRDSLGRWLVLGLLAGTLGCRREEVRAYTAPRERRAEAPLPAAGAAAVRQARPKIDYQLPAGWEPSPNGPLSLASFRVTGGRTNGPGAEVSITPLGQLAGKEFALVNLWREQVGQPAITEADLPRTLSPVEVAGTNGTLFEVAGTMGEAHEVTRIVTAILHRPEASWFFKLAGEDATVTAARPAFIQFLKTVRIAEAPAAGPGAAASAPEVAAGAGPRPKWTVPAGWQEVPAGQMQLAKFTPPPAGPARAEVSVSVFPSDTGGTLANVNRWRRQLQLAEIDEGELSKFVQPLAPTLPGSLLVDLVNGERRLLGAIVPREGTYWFYKLLGDAPAVEAQRAAFTEFARSQP